MNLLLLFLIADNIWTSQQQETYRAAVVEYNIGLPSENVARYYDLMAEAAEQNVDILVFPESTFLRAETLNRTVIAEQFAFHIPEPSDNITLCHQVDLDATQMILQNLSCVVRSHRMYVVINLIEKLPCNNQTQAQMNDERTCATDGWYLFNSNVVFDRSGTVFSRYRKTHLFGESSINITAGTDVQSFHTDFGIEFGQLICFDLQFLQPAQALLDKGVKHFVLTLMWYSEYPFLTAVQFEEAWARTHQVNLLAAGANDPQNASGGSGIFSESGIRTAVMTGDTATMLLVADVPKHNIQTEHSPVTFGSNHRAMNVWRDHLHHYTYTIIDLEQAQSGYEEEICSNGLCCNFYVKVRLYEKPTVEYYRFSFLVFSGVRTYSGVATGGIQNCGVSACTGDEFSTCGLSFNTSSITEKYVIFEEIRITGEFSLENATHFPTSLRENLIPLNVSSYIYKNNASGSDLTEIEYRLISECDDLMSFGIFGRVYSLDGLPDDYVYEFVTNGECSRFVCNLLWINFTAIISIAFMYGLDTF